MSQVITFSADIKILLDILQAGIQNCLQHNLVGFYLRGSLAMGDFIPETSDLDTLAVTETPVDENEFAALFQLHKQISALPNPFARRLEIAYIDRYALKSFEPGLRHPTLGQGEELSWTEHHENWILERWVLRQYGLILFGPDPKELIDPFTQDEISVAVRLRLPDWVDWAQNPNDPDWQLPRSHKAYVVETMCRVLFTLSRGEMCSKRAAVEWALQNLPEPWRATVERSQVWRTDSTFDASIIEEVRQFVLWVGTYT